MLDFMTIIKISGVDQDFNLKKWGGIDYFFKEIRRKNCGALTTVFSLGNR